MKLEARYKQSEVGVIPEDWRLVPFGRAFEFLTTATYSKAQTSEFGDYLYVHYGDIHTKWNHFLNFDNAILPAVSHQQAHRYPMLKEGDLIMADASEDYDGIGKCVEVRNLHERKAISGLHTLLLRDREHEIADTFKGYIHTNPLVKRQFDRLATGMKVFGLSRSILKIVEIPLPPKVEQEAIAEVLSDADALVESLEQLIAKKRHIKQGTMQVLLTGKKRLPGFSGDWEMKRIEEIASPSTEKNDSADQLPVLTCSKHLGFVDSLGYFKSQVFSKNTSGYKVIQRGQIGYPSNHIEEGSIGLQDLYDLALVSPIYVVFSVGDNVNSYFLHRLLKLDSYRQRFETATNASVNRRGSLRWPTFSQIIVGLPNIEEQNAIAEILIDMENEIAALDARLTTTRQLKQGMMNNLLTGKIRLV